jgi:hypothetical protein
MVVLVQRIVRSKGSKAAVLVGKVKEVSSLDALRQMTMRRKQVFSYLTEDGAEGTMRSGKVMRKVDANVRNVVPTLKR